MKMSNPRYRPKRKFAQAVRQVYRPEVTACPYCGQRLQSTGSLYINKDVQTLTGVVNVRAYGYRCVNQACLHLEKRYRAVKAILRVSLPYGTYGLDVIAFIGWQRDRQYRQFVEIQQMLQERGLVISERHVGRLYRQYLALVGGLSQQLLAQLKETDQLHGGVIWALDGLQPDQDGTQLYVLYEIVSQRPVAAAWLDKRDTAHLQAWLKPYSQLDLRVLATLSDGEAAEVEALKQLWPEAPHQMCQVHFLGDIAQPIREGDQHLRQAMADHLAELPPVPDPQPVAPTAATLPLSSPKTALVAGLPSAEPSQPSGDTSVNQAGASAQLLAVRPTVEPCASTNSLVQTDQMVKTKPALAQPGRSILTLPVAPDPLVNHDPVRDAALRSSRLAAALSRLQELECLFHKAFQQTWRQSSRKPLTFGGLAGYRLLQSLVMALQFYLPQEGHSYLQTLLELGQQTLQQVAPLAQQVQQAAQMLRQLAHLLAVPLKTEVQPWTVTASLTHSLVVNQPSEGQQLKQLFHRTLTHFARATPLRPIVQAFLTQTKRLLAKWEADLFHCYDIPLLPSSNALLEACFNRLRRSQRRISGRKKTAELRRTAHFQVLLLPASSPQELWDLLATVPLAAYQQARRRLEAAEERQRWLYRFRRWPLKTTTAMIDEYLVLRQLVHQLDPADP